MRRKGRTALTSAGVAIGVGLIVALLSIAAGVQRTAADLIHVGRADFGLFQEGAADLTKSLLPVSLASSVRHEPGVNQVASVFLHVTRVGGNDELRGKLRVDAGAGRVHTGAARRVFVAARPAGAADPAHRAGERFRLRAVSARADRDQMRRVAGEGSPATLAAGSHVARVWLAVLDRSAARVRDAQRCRRRRSGPREGGEHGDHGCCGRARHPAAVGVVPREAEVPKRRGLERELKRSLAHVKRYGVNAALVYLDLDGFKRISDRHGHAAGDAVLKAVAMVLDRHSRESDGVARVGGDEFVLLLWSCSEADAQVKAQAIEVAIARMTPTHAGAVLQVGASCGVAMLLPLDRPQDLLDRADRAMYARKRVRGDLRRAV